MHTLCQLQKGRRESMPRLVPIQLSCSHVKTSTTTKPKGIGSWRVLESISTRVSCDKKFRQVFFTLATCPWAKLLFRSKTTSTCQPGQFRVRSHQLWTPMASQRYRPFYKYGISILVCKRYLKHDCRWSWGSWSIAEWIWCWWISKYLLR